VCVCVCVCVRVCVCVCARAQVARRLRCAPLLTSKGGGAGKGLFRAHRQGEELGPATCLILRVCGNMRLPSFFMADDDFMCGCITDFRRPSTICRSMFLSPIDPWFRPGPLPCSQRALRPPPLLPALAPCATESCTSTQGTDWRTPPGGETATKSPTSPAGAPRRRAPGGRCARWTGGSAPGASASRPACPTGCASWLGAGPAAGSRT